MIEQPPQINEYSQTRVLREIDSDSQAKINKLLDDYAYWTHVKYKTIRGFESPRHIWHEIKSIRRTTSIDIYPKYRIHFSVSNSMQRLCHFFDMQFGGSWGNESVIPIENRERYLISSIIEEAISSSQMEGASTTRKIAKDLIRKGLKPKDKSQQMIHNNYVTIKYLCSHTSEPLTKELILHIHSLMTHNTMDKPEDCGRFRINNDVVVENGITHEIVHTPPSFEQIEDDIKWLCDFANNQNDNVFIHPIIKATIIHYFISYLHPFVDGNGRTARALFHWYLLKEGYWLTEYLSISRIIKGTKISYEKSFLQSESDGNDIGYFITYHLNALDKSFVALKRYISKKSAEKRDQNRLLRAGTLTPRQAEILYMLINDYDRIITVKDVTAKTMVTPTTAKSDINILLKMGLLSEIMLNKQRHGYIRGPKYHDLLEKINQ